MIRAQSPLPQAAKAKRKKPAEMQLACGWRGCQEICAGEWTLNGHISQHLEQYDREHAAEEQQEHVCSWQDCDFRTSCLEEFKRHSYYHGYYLNLLMQGKMVCDLHPEIPACTAPARQSCKLPNLDQNYQCGWTDCDWEFVSLVQFQDHIAKHAALECDTQTTSKGERSKLQCKWRLCHKVVDSRYRLMEHLSSHANKKEVACFHCGELFRTKTTLFDHLRRQPANNTNSFQCAQCFKLFATEKFLRSHLTTHINNHKCTMCDMTCSSSGTLATHIRYRHLKERPFQCSECETRCVRKSDLAKHIQMVHSNTPHQCGYPDCDYSVRTYTQMRKHLLEVHGNTAILYACDCCERFFKCSKSISAHMIKKHGYELPSGHKRFTYQLDENGFYRLKTTRIESLEVAQQVLSSQVNPAVEIELKPGLEFCFEIVKPIDTESERNTVSNDTNEVQLNGPSMPSLLDDQ